MTSRLRSTLAFAAIAVLASASTVAVLHPAGAPASSVVQPAANRPAPDSSSDAQAKAVAPLAALTPTEKEYVYVPVSPCRIVDTRAAGGKLAVDAQRSFVVKGTTGFTAQGGTSTGCGIPAGATAATFSFTSTQSSGNGKINAWPHGSTEQLSTTLSYSKAVNATTSPTIGLQLTGSPHLRVHNTFASTHLVIEVTGYYVAQMYAYATPSGTLTRGSRVVSIAKAGTGVYNVTFDTTLTGCVGVAAADYSGYTANVYPTGGAVMTVYTYNPAGALADYYFNLSVVC